MDIYKSIDQKISKTMTDEAEKLLANLIRILKNSGWLTESNQVGELKSLMAYIIKHIEPDMNLPDNMYQTEIVDLESDVILKDMVNRKKIAFADKIFNELNK